VALRDIDRLIEMGLSRYGAGDLEGAILLWEEALAIEPDNAQASSYVDYVRLNYDVLSTGGVEVESNVADPFGIQEEPEYQIEIVPGAAESPPVDTAPSLESVDDGWFEGDAEPAAPAAAASPPPAAPVPAEPEPADEPAPLTLEMEADEPPPPDFEDATREYQNMKRAEAEAALQRPVPARPPTAPDELDEGTGGPTQGFFRGDELTGGATQGFFRGDEATQYQHIGEEPDPGFETDTGTGAFPSETTGGFGHLETEVRKRDTGFVKPVVTIPPKVKPADEPRIAAAPESVSVGSAPTMDQMSLETTSSDEDLLSSLPTPRPAKRIDAPPDNSQPPRMTRDLPAASREPARDPSSLSQAEVVLSHAPTRELGLRAAAAVGGLHNPADDDAPTGQTDVRSIREAARRNDGDAARDAVPPRVSSQDPVTAIAAEILDQVDANTPSEESVEERTRRRITRLVETAASLADAGQYERSVMAADLALAEEPDSAVAQKLVTRHRDAITSVFQGYIGDLDRTPRLAKSLSELGSAQISPRAAFLLSRIDGMLTIDELLDVSGMPRLEAYRYLCQLYLRDILR
jgi:hypothetical protein